MQRRFKRWYCVTHDMVFTTNIGAACHKKKGCTVRLARFIYEIEINAKRR